MGRRALLRKTGTAALAATVYPWLVFGEHFPQGAEPLWLPQDGPLPAGKHKDLVLLNDRPWNVETPAHLLDDNVTPADKMFVRNNGQVPGPTDPATWTLLVDGESVAAPMSFGLGELKQFPVHTYQLLLECAGNGRHEFNPPASGNQWTTGGVSCAQWTGVRLRDVLEKTGIKKNAVYVGYYGTDAHLSGDPNKHPISRGIPIKRALEDDVLLAWEMNAAPIPLMHGFPLRLVVGGWPASCSGKWLRRLSVRDRVHDGEKMNGKSYRIPCGPVAPGTVVPDENMCIIESMPVKSLITYPATGAVIQNGQPLSLKGHAWAGDTEITGVEVSCDFGATWQKCQLKPPPNRNSWQHWTASLSLPKKGYYEIWARATEANGVSQPMLVPGWNPGGYNNNACHRIAVKVV